MPRIETNEILDVRGTLQLTSATVNFRDNSIARQKLQTDDLAEHTIDLTALRVHDAVTSFLPSSASSDDLALVGGTFGTDTPRVRSGDAASTTLTQRGRFQVAVPSDYKAGEDLQVRIRAAMDTVSDTTATVDVECYKHDGDGAAGSDICATSATTINSTSHADKDFVITPTGIVAGDTLDVRVTVAITDGATGSGVVAEISKISLLADIS